MIIRCAAFISVSFWRIEFWREDEVSTGSDSDRVAANFRIAIAGNRHPVATAPGTDLIAIISLTSLDHEAITAASYSH
jgi:hypothetical protein